MNLEEFLKIHAESPEYVWQMSVIKEIFYGERITPETPELPLQGGPYIGYIGHGVCHSHKSGHDNVMLLFSKEDFMIGSRTYLKQEQHTISEDEESKQECKTPEPSGLLSPESMAKNGCLGYPSQTTGKDLTNIQKALEKINPKSIGRVEDEI